MPYKHFRLVTDGDSAITFIYFDRQGQSVNTFNKEAMLELEQIIDNISSSDYCRGLIFASDKKSWIAGADITEFFELFNAEDQVILDVVKKGHEVFNKIEDLSIPTVAWINGASMGGGTELALACTYRVANANENVQIGLPEVKLGILPAWGGTTRLPRLIGADNAIDLICSGRSVGHKEAMKLGLVDALFEDDSDAVPFFNNIISTGSVSGTFEKIRNKKTGPVKLNIIEAMMTFKFAGSQVKAKAGKYYPAPMKALGVMEACRKMNRDQALEAESLAFLELIKTDVAKNLINIFVNERKLKSEALKFDFHPLKKITVLGAGVMGSGIAFAIANKAGYKVTLYDPSSAALERARKENRDYLMQKVQKKYIDIDELNRVMDLIKESTNLNASVEEADLVIEAIPENLELKQKTFNEISDIVGQDCILATNTSTFTVDEVFNTVNKKERCIGMHFFNPVSKMPLVEVVKGSQTSDIAIGTISKVSQEMGKTPVVMNDCAGFVANRLLLAYLMEADRIISDGYDIAAIDKAMEDYGWPMGPAQLIDLIGIDIAVHCIKSIKPDYDLSASIINDLYNSGHFGQKTSSGFYTWKDKKKGKLVIINSDKYIDAKDIEDRLMSVMVSEAENILNENIVDEGWKINMILVMGLGFPPFRGGIL